MFLSNIEGLVEDAGDFVILVDYGQNGISIYSQHQELEDAMGMMLRGDLGSPMAMVKLCRIETPVEKDAVACTSQ